MGTMRRAPRRKDGGFTIISVLIAMVLLSIGIFALMSVAVQAFAMQTQGGTRSTALSIARTYMEQVRARDPATLDSEAEASVDSEGRLDPDGAYTRELIVVSKGTHLDEVTVRVRVPGLGLPIELVTLVYDQL